MHIAKQYSVFMVNKPGVLAQVLTEFANEKINIIALTMTDTVEHGVMRVIGSPAKKVHDVLANLNMKFEESDVLCINLSNKPGAMAVVAQKLSMSHMNISYAYCTAGARGGRTTGIIKVPDIKKAIDILEKDNAKSKKAGKSKKAIRRSPGSRK